MLQDAMGKAILLQAYLSTRYLGLTRFPDRAALARWQEGRVAKMLDWVLPRSAFYRERFHGLPPHRWREVEPIDKSTMMANFDRLNTAGLNKSQCLAIAHRAEHTRDFKPKVGQITIGLSSGTSGNKGLFLADPLERYRWAGTILAKILPGSLLGRHRVALFLRSGSNLYDTIGSRRIVFEYFDLIDDLAHNLTRLDSFAPTVLAAPPSMLRYIAEAQEKGVIEIAPRKIISVAEVLDPMDERAIEHAFAMPVHQVYQATEGFIACTCPQGTLHLNEDVLVVEKDYLDRRAGKFMPILTDFRRSTQPIIRYRLDDILTERASPCPCGSPAMAIASIEGRCDDIFYLASQDGTDDLRPVFPDFIRRAIITATDSVTAYQVSQLDPGTIDIALQTAPAGEDDSTQAAVRASLDALFARLRCVAPTLRFVGYAHTPGLTKLKRVRRCFDVGAASALPAARAMAI